MWEDPIVEEVHRVRDELAAKFNYDVDAIFADLMKRQMSLGDRLMLQKKRDEPKAETGAGPNLDTSGSTPSEQVPAK